MYFYKPFTLSDRSDDLTKKIEDNSPMIVVICP